MNVDRLTRAFRRAPLVLLLLATLALALSACAEPGGAGAAGHTVDAAATGPSVATAPPVAMTASEAPPQAPEPRFASEPPAAWDGPTMSVPELPPEALVTLQLIAEGGPFPYDQDGGTFQNREGILPDEPMGTYAEYTVETPGSPDRGARRLVVGDDRYVYYSDDHYDSFSFVSG
jgi:ribonuclease T1